MLGCTTKIPGDFLRLVHDRFQTRSLGRRSQAAAACAVKSTLPLTSAAMAAGPADDDGLILKPSSLKKPFASAT